MGASFIMDKYINNTEEDIPYKTISSNYPNELQSCTAEKGTYFKGMQLAIGTTLVTLISHTHVFVLTRDNFDKFTKIVIEEDIHQ